MLTELVSDFRLCYTRDAEKFMLSTFQTKRQIFLCFLSYNFFLIVFEVLKPFQCYIVEIMTHLKEIKDKTTF